MIATAVRSADRGRELDREDNPLQHRRTPRTWSLRDWKNATRARFAAYPRLDPGAKVMAALFAHRHAYGDRKLI